MVLNPDNQVGAQTFHCFLQKYSFPNTLLELSQQTHQTALKLIKFH